LILKIKIDFKNKNCFKKLKLILEIKIILKSILKIKIKIKIIR